MRILQVITALDFGGSEGLLNAFVPRMRARGAEVAVCSLMPIGRIGRELREQGIEVISLDVTSAEMWKLLPKLSAVVGRRRWDVIHTHLFWGGVAGRLMGKWHRVPKIVSSKETVPTRLPPDRLLVERGTIRLADRIIACSEAVRAWVVSHLHMPAGRTLAVYNGIDAGRFREGSRKNTPPRIVTVGRLVDAEKGQKVLLHAVAILKRRGHPVQCRIVGDGPSRPELEAIVADQILADSVQLVGYLLDVRDELAEADIFVLPSREEGLGVAGLEAMAAALPLVGSHVGGIPEIVQPGVTGFLFPVGDAEALADALLPLLQDEPLRRRMGEAGRSLLRGRFDIESMVGRYFDVYTGLA